MFVLWIVLHVGSIIFCEQHLELIILYVVGKDNIFTVQQEYIFGKI